MKWLQLRLREPSTMAGLSSLLMAIAIFKPDWSQYAASIGAALGGLAGVTSDPGAPKQ